MTDLETFIELKNGLPLTTQTFLDIQLNQVIEERDIYEFLRWHLVNNENEISQFDLYAIIFLINILDYEEKILILSPH